MGPIPRAQHGPRCAALVPAAADRSTVHTDPTQPSVGEQMTRDPMLVALDAPLSEGAELPQGGEATIALDPSLPSSIGR
jgi:hypothetical protein